MILSALASRLAGVVLAATTTVNVSMSGNGTKYLNKWAQGNWWGAVNGPFIDKLGAIFPLVVALGLAGIIWIYDDSPSPAIVLAILLGGVLIPLLPAAAQNIAGIIVLFGIAGAVWLAWTNKGNSRR